MDLTGLSFITVIGGLMAIAGVIGLVYYIARYRRIQRRFEQGETENPDIPPNTFASFWLINGFLHIGMLLLVLGGAGLLFYGSR